MKQLARTSAAVPLSGFAAELFAQSPRREPRGAPSPVQPERPEGLTEGDEEFLDELEKATFLYFWEQGSPETGIVRDRFNVRTPDKSDLGSIAATGFGFTALCIGHQRGWVSYEEARGRALAGLRFLWEQMPHHRGFFYHWANIDTGDRLWDSEVSSIDSAILLCGVLTCRKHFGDAQIDQLARQVFNRVDWNWLSEDTRILPHGWRPETGFLQFRWENYSEMMMMYLLGMGSYLASVAGRRLERMEAHRVRVSRHPLYRLVRTALHPPGTRKPGSISGASATSMPTIFRIRFLPPTSIAVSAWTWPPGSPATAMISGA